MLLLAVYVSHIQYTGNLVTPRRYIFLLNIEYVVDLNEKVLQSLISQLYNGHGCDN